MLRQSDIDYFIPYFFIIYDKTVKFELIYL